MNLINTFPVSTGRGAGDGLDIFVAIEIGDTLVDGRTAWGDMVDFAYVDGCGSTIWLLPILGKVAGAPKLFVKIRGAVVCRG